ncbi:MAG: cell division protein FtsA [Nitrospirales bacterium]|nr:cell division protein FtsA [Nitrospirales bacterium]
MPKKEHIVVGLDIGTTKIGVIVAEIKDGNEVHIIGVGSSPSRGLRKGVVVNIESTVESIKKAVEEAELMAAVQINSVYIGIAGSHIASQSAHGVVALKRQEVSKADVDRAVASARASAVVAQDRRILHVLPREFRVDDQEGIRKPVGIFGSRLEVDVHIVTGALSSAQNLVKCVRQAGLQVVEIVLQPLASSEAILTEEEKELGVAMVDLGGGTSDLAIFTEGSISHTAVLPVGGQHLTSDLQIGLRTSHADAEKIKIQHGVSLAEMVQGNGTVEVPSVGGRPPRMLSKSMVAEIIEARVEEIFDLVRCEIRRSGYEGRLAAGAVITGGTSLLEGMPDLAERVLDLPVRRGRPVGVGGLRDLVNNPMFATGVGLILHASGINQRIDQAYASVGEAGSPRMWGFLSRVRTWLLDYF